jgi:hypothetical protein
MGKEVVLFYLIGWRREPSSTHQGTAATIIFHLSFDSFHCPISSIEFLNPLMHRCLLAFFSD